MQACHKKKHCTSGCRMPKKGFIAMACNLELHATKL